MGKFVSQNVETASSIISIEAISQDLTLSKIKHNRVFKNKTLEDLLKTLAKDLNVTPQIDPN